MVLKQFHGLHSKLLIYHPRVEPEGLTEGCLLKNKGVLPICIAY